MLPEYAREESVEHSPCMVENLSRHTCLECNETLHVLSGDIFTIQYSVSTPVPEMELLYYHDHTPSFAIPICLFDDMEHAYSYTCRVAVHHELPSC